MGHPPVAVTDSLQSLVLLQAFDGSWELTESLARVACHGVPLSNLQPEGGFSSKVWATALAIAFLETALASRAEEWEFVAAKAQAWLAANLSRESAHVAGPDR